MLEFYWVFVRTGIPHEHVLRGQSVRNGMVPQLGYAWGSYHMFNVTFEISREIDRFRQPLGLIINGSE